MKYFKSDTYEFNLDLTLALKSKQIRYLKKDCNTILRKSSIKNFKENVSNCEIYSIPRGKIQISSRILSLGW